MDRVSVSLDCWIGAYCGDAVDTPFFDLAMIGSSYLVADFCFGWFGIGWSVDALTVEFFFDSFATETMGYLAREARSSRSS